MATKSPAKDETASPAVTPSSADLAKADVLRTVAGTMRRHHGTTDWNDRDAREFSRRVMEDLAAQADVLDPPPPPPAAPPAPEAAPAASEYQPPQDAPKTA